jgi:hypothetical protein
MPGIINQFRAGDLFELKVGARFDAEFDWK